MASQQQLPLLLVGAAASTAATAGEWHHLLYTKVADGYDDHDTPQCLDMKTMARRPPDETVAACSVGDGKIQLRGCVQCSANLVSCWDQPMAHFATLPAECMHPASGKVKLGPQLPDQIPAGSEISVGEDGKLTMLAAAPSTWNLVLDGVAIPTASRWGWPFILTVFLAAIIYVGGGVGYNHRVKQMPLTRDAFPNKEYWYLLFIRFHTLPSSEFQLWR
jgi:hypothetical protein